MLNKNNQRELAYVVKIDMVEPIVGSDHCEAAYVHGWHIMVRTGTFRPGDLAVYFEIDSKVDTTRREFEFLENRGGKIKTQRYTFGGKGNFISQGLLMSFDDFGWSADKYAEGTFLTRELKVTYADDEDNVRKAPSTDRYRSMQDRHKKLFKSKFGKWMMKREFGRKIMFFFFGKKKDKKTDWPSWVVKTDEERVQNMSWLFPACKTKWIATEKIDGTSTTFTMRNEKKRKLIVCSRNVVYDAPEKEARNYYKDTCGNVYLEMAEKYNMQKVLSDMIDYYGGGPLEDKYGTLQFITIQGETYGGNIQKRNYGPEHRLAVFNIIFGYKNKTFRLNPIGGKKLAEVFGLEYVPIVDPCVILPDTCDEVVAMAHGDSVIDGGLREGLVFRDFDGNQSFKAVDPEFLLKYHAN